MDWRDDIEAAVADFATVARLAGDPIAPGDIVCEFHDAPHRQPTRLPEGKMAIYGFWGDGCWLKVGKVGPNSSARYTSQHYTGSAISTLAGSLIGDANMRTVTGFNPAACGDWIKGSTHRVNVLLPARRGGPLLSLLEAFLHLRLKPRYEG